MKNYCARNNAEHHAMNNHSKRILKQTAFLFFKKHFNSFYIVLDNDYFTKIIYSPSLILGELIINLTNIWSLWHGMSFISIFMELFELLKNIFTKLTNRYGFNLLHFVELFRKSNVNNILNVSALT